MSRKVALLLCFNPMAITNVPILLLLNLRRLLKSVLIVVMQHAAKACRADANMGPARVSCKTSTCQAV